MKKTAHKYGNKGKPANGAQAGIVSSTQQAGAQQVKCPGCGCSFDAAESAPDGDENPAVQGAGLQNAKAKAKKMIMSYQQMNQPQ